MSKRRMGDDAYNRVKQIVSRKQEEGETLIHPAQVADEALDKALGKHKRDLMANCTEVYIVALLKYRDIARVVCRGFEEIDQDAGYGFFSGKLQPYYPVAARIDGEPAYIKRDEMSEEDKNFNVDRLRKTGNSFVAHADALEAWWDSKTQGRASGRKRH